MSGTSAHGARLYPIDRAPHCGTSTRRGIFAGFAELNPHHARLRQAYVSLSR
jgi:hypothetical protein